MDQILRVFGVIAVMLAVIFAAYFMTRYVAVKANGASGKARYFKLIDRFSVSKDKSFILIAVGQSVYLIGITNQGMTVIDQKELSDFLDEESLTENNFFPNFLSGLKNAGPFRRKGEGDKNSFSDVIKRARQKENNHEE